MNPPKNFVVSVPRREPMLQPVNGIVQPAVVAPPGRPGRQTNVLDGLRIILNVIWRRNWAVHFQKPVDANALGVPNYHNLVKYPMDLGTIKKRLANNYYCEAEEAIDDFKLVFENCLMFNKPGSVVHVAGQELKNLFYQRLALLDLNNEMELKPKAKKRKRASRW